MSGCCVNGVFVTFDYAKWQITFPEFTGVSEGQAQMYFDLGALFLRNDGSGPVQCETQQTTLLGLLTAHIAELFRTTADGHSASQMVGRITQASQGIVSMSTELNLPDGTPQFFAQTKYGLLYWSLTAAYRMARTIVGPRRYFGPFYGGRPFW